MPTHLMKRSLLSEPMFLQALCLERKRTERSRKPLVLVLLDTGRLLQNDGADRVRGRMASSMCAAVRETDVIGWYKEGSALGVICSELGTGEKESILEVLRRRVTTALQSSLQAGELNHIDISFHWFPEDAAEHATGSRALYPDLMQREAATRVSRIIKRSIDVLGSSLALLILSPIFLAIAVAVKLSSPGPVLFRQRRVGQHGIPFTFLKFRSMYCGNDSQIHREYVRGFIAGNDGSSARAEGHGKVVYKITQDPRVTGVGRFLRKTSADELPQLLNVLKGEMSLVGPRPPIPYEVEAYDIWHRRRLLEVKPGITGLWQVNGRSRLRFDDMVRLDLKYATAWSLWLDLKILLNTPRAIASGDGAY
jgi:lipopolysaccharide/colanic/teichoic acid biosynthesis glycosyltransferase